MITDTPVMLYIVHPYVRTLNERMYSSFKRFNKNKLTPDWERHLAKEKRKRRNKKKNR